MNEQANGGDAVGRVISRIKPRAGHICSKCRQPIEELSVDHEGGCFVAWPCRHVWTTTELTEEE